MEEISGKGMFITLVPAACVRIDRIITLFGKPAAAYDEYDGYANKLYGASGRVRQRAVG